MSEQKRLLDYRNEKSNWKNWGPYISERAWGTVREDYSGDDPWSSCTFDEAHKRVFRWGEDSLGGICDRFQYICLAFSLWNGNDPILKERLFGLSSHEGNHGEDVKELYYYLDATPTSSYLKMLYKYPHAAFPYQQLREENAKRGLDDPEYEIYDTGVFDSYFDVVFEYAKADHDDVFGKVTVTNRGSQAVPLTILPTIWFRNTWTWGYENGPTGDDGGRPRLDLEESHIALKHPRIGEYFFYVQGAKEFLFCDNDPRSEYPKDSIGHHLIKGTSCNPKKEGTKAAAIFHYTIDPGASKQFSVRICRKRQKDPFKNVEKVFDIRIKEANDFYEEIQAGHLNDALKKVQRKAFAGLLFSKQFYYIDQLQWERGDPRLNPKRAEERNVGWEHLTTYDLISMPDKWEYPYLCSWDLAFHCIPMVIIDSSFAKRQLELMTREWYMHPNGQIPAYEWNFADVNPPVHAWALWRIFKIDAKKHKKEDRPFLEGCFHKLLLNFTWWVNRKDIDDRNVFQGGFLGMDNISVFDRSRTLPTGGHIDQSDGTAWMSFYCITMMKIALHLAQEEPIYQDSATKFFEHFLRISAAMTACIGHGEEHSLWNEEDGFFYDILHLPNGTIYPLKVRSLVGLLPLLAVETIEPDLLRSMPVFERRMEWFTSKRPKISHSIACLNENGTQGRRLLSIVDQKKLKKILTYMLDEDEFLSEYGIRSVSKYHEKHPYIFKADSSEYEVKYIPGESNNRMFGGNSNWRGPIWMPINFLLIEALQRFHHFYGENFKIEFPTYSGNWINLWEVSQELSKRLIRLFLPNEEGNLPIHGEETYHDEPLFHEYFNGDTGKGLGASHQTGWTALIAKLIQQSGELL